MLIFFIKAQVITIDIMTYMTCGYSCANTPVQTYQVQQTFIDGAAYQPQGSGKASMYNS